MVIGCWIDLPSTMQLQHLAHRGVALEHVFAGLELVGRTRMNVAPATNSERLVDHALAAELLGDVADALAALDHDRALAVERAGGLELALAQ